MSSHGEQVERQAFVQASIDATREALTDETLRPHLAHYFSEDDLAYHEQLTDRMFPAEVVDGAIRIPEDRQQTDDIPVVAIAPGETPQISPDFAWISPVMREHMATQLAEWGATLPPEAYAEAAEYVLRYGLEAGSVGFPNAFTSEKDKPGLFAAVYTIAAPLPFKRELLPNSNGPALKYARTRPVLGIKYDGPDSPVPSLGTMIHEETHGKQHEESPIFDALTEERQRKESMRAELGAYRAGSRAVRAQLDAEHVKWDDLTEFDRFQTRIEEQRGHYNRKNPDPYAPSRELMRKWGPSILMDDISQRLTEG